MPNNKDPSKKPGPLVFTEEWQEETAENAVRYGYISLDHLPYIMAKERGYDDVLPKLWKKFQCDLRGRKEPKITTEKDRVGPWQKLFYRLAFGIVGGIRSRSLGDIPRLKTYCYNKVSAELEAYDLEAMNDVAYVKLEELEKYFVNIIEIPLPIRLFPDRKQQNLEKSVELKMVFPCKPGTMWDEIYVFLIDDDTVRIKTPQGERQSTYRELDMCYIRSANKPTKLWYLFKLFAENNGFLSAKNAGYDPKRPSTAKRLNKHLQKLFGIEESIYQGHYKKEKGYKTKIHFSDTRQSTIISKPVDEDELSKDTAEIFKEAQERHSQD